MNLLFDYRAYQDFYKRGIGRYVEELFKRVIILNKHGLNAILIDPTKHIPRFPQELQRTLYQYSVRDFENENVKQLFDIFINGSSTIVNLPYINAIDYLYPAAVMKKVRKKVCILHDFVPLYYRHFIPTIRDEINYMFECEALKYMDHIFTNSKFVAESGAKLIDRPISDFTVLYGGADTEKFNTENTAKRYSRKGRSNDIVNVSDVCPRKNYKGVTKAFCKAYLSGEIPNDSRLVFICKAPKLFVRTVKAVTNEHGLKLGKQVIITGFLPDKKMAYFIGHATCSIFPSFYEGLGLPILESYAAGTPCIASGITATKEITYDEAQFNPYDLVDMEKKIIAVYKDDRMMINSLKYGEQLFKQINWDNSANIMYTKLRYYL